MHPAEFGNELLQCFDEHGRPTETQARTTIRANPGRYWFAVSRVWLINDHAQLMCSKRATTLNGNPGKWQTHFGGHVAAWQTIKESAQKELGEEAGIHQPMELHLIDHGCNKEKKVFFESYALRFNGQPSDLTFTDHEVTEAKWMSLREYWQDQARHPEAWCNHCSPEQQQLIVTWLNKHK